MSLLQTPAEIQERDRKAQILVETARQLENQRYELLQQLTSVTQSLSSIWAEYGLLHNTSVLINRLPSEVLCLIFSHCLSSSKPAEGQGSFPYEAEKRPPEITITHVCQHWRQHALQFPQLWSTFRYKTPKWRRDPIQRFNAYMERSYPLSVDLYVYLKGVPHEDLSILQAAAHHVERWRGVNIVSDDNNFDWSKLQTALEHKAAQNLEYLSFRPSLVVTGHTSNGHVTPVSRLDPKILTLGAPKLSQVRLDATVPYFFLPPLSNASTICLDAKYMGPTSVTWGAFLGILALPNLENLSIGGHVVSPPNSDQLHEPILVASLKHLRWSSDGERLSQFISHLDAPNLESLILCGMQLAPQPVTPEAKVHLPALRSLHIIECGGLSTHAIRFLAEGSPNLRRLFMSYYRPKEGDHLLDYLNQESKDGNTHWPNLEGVTCYLHQVDEVAPYLDFVQSRVPSPEGEQPSARRSLMGLRVSKRLLRSWETQSPEGYSTLRDLCALSCWETVRDILPQVWPPGCQPDLSMANDRSDQFGFAVDWNEF
ncbi:hypothetical protein CC2G_001478 [Coprinopsis cinerea AmutBmut pab1-1]|nr:hypothetical protein CC2G_001478 [Coprinopsis cinerea AmutBmut pab1-1]